MIILEGPDCIGKTTAAKTMCNAFNWKYKHMDRPSADFDHFAGYLEQLEENCVYDRFHLGALVYGRIVAPHQNIDRVRLVAVMRWIYFMQGIVVIMYASSDRWLDEQLTKCEKTEMYSRRQIMMVNEVYRHMAKGGLEDQQWCQLSHDVCDLGFPTDEQLKLWRDFRGNWRER